MARFINPVPEYKPNSKLYFFKSGTNTPIITYKDELEVIANTQPVLCDAAGNTPNVFYSGSAKLIVLDEYDVQYIERDPVGGEKELGDFTLWDTVVNYDLNDIVDGSDNKFYISLSNTNQGNDPTTTATKWSEIRFIGVWNTNKSYKIGDVVQTANGDLWKAVSINSASDPSIDDGAKWLPAINGAKIPEVISLIADIAQLDWIAKAVDFTAVENEAYQIDGSANIVDVTMPALVAGKPYTFHNESTSAFKVQILNPTNTIRYTGGTIAAGTDLELAAGNSVQLVAKSTTILEIVGVKI
jgi:hypothetical protein